MGQNIPHSSNSNTCRYYYDLKHWTYSRLLLVSTDSHYRSLHTWKNIQPI